MIKHAFLFFNRLIRKSPGYYFVSMLGITLSLSSFMLLFMFIQDELAYDEFHLNKDRIYRITTHLKVSDVNYDMATSQFPAAEALKTEIGEIEHAVRVYPVVAELEHHDKKYEERVLMVDSSFFSLFTFPFVFGDSRSVLAHQSNVILTKTTAVKFFGIGNPLGRTISWMGQTLEVAGVIEDVPEQSHLKFDVIIPLQFQLSSWKSQTGVEGRENKWFWTGAYTYVLLHESATSDAVMAKLPGIVNKYFPERYREHGRFELQPLKDIHLKSNLFSEMEPGGNMLYIRLFSIVAIVIIIVSVINLINLTWFKISGRIRELGIRKFLGQNASVIVAQLSMESILVGVVAFIAAIALGLLFLDDFNTLVNKSLRFWTIPNLSIIGGSLVMIILICTLAVIRPAVRYARQSPGILIAQRYSNATTSRLRNILVGSQVCFSFVLLAFTLIISGQVDFFRNKDLGFNKENIVVVELNEDFNQHLEAFKEELKKSQYIIEVAGGREPGAGYDGWRFVPEGTSHEKPLVLPLAWVDYDFISTLDMKLVAGENFNLSRAVDDTLWPFIINKRAAVELGWVNDPLNKTMEIFAPGTTNIMAKGIVIGIIEDFHFETLHNPVKPIVLTISPWFQTTLIKVTEPSNQVFAHIEESWKKFSGKPLVYNMLDKKLEKLYTNETKLGNVILFFTLIALYLTCYGMFAMSSLLFSSRLKEVAIRKVFGADQLSIVKRFYFRYVLFTMLAILVGLPVIMYFGNSWLQNFHYRIDLSYPIFVKAAVTILLVGLFSVSYYLLKVSFSNPIKFLRNE